MTEPCQDWITQDGVYTNLGIVMTIIGVILIIISVMALFPETSRCVQPIFFHITESVFIKEIDSLIDVIGGFVTLGLATISGGYVLFKPGYKGLQQKYLKKYIDEL